MAISDLFPFCLIFTKGFFNDKLSALVSSLLEIKHTVSLMFCNIYEYSKKEGDEKNNTVGTESFLNKLASFLRKKV